MPTEVGFPKHGKYELQETKSKEEIARYEEIGMWKDTVWYEKLQVSQDDAEYEELDVPDVGGDYFSTRKYAFQMMLCAIKRPASWKKPGKSKYDNKHRHNDKETFSTFFIAWKWRIWSRDFVYFHYCLTITQ